MPPQILAGVRVIELGQLIAGPFCGKILGDFGADVVKIEPPGKGDPLAQLAADQGRHFGVVAGAVAEQALGRRSICASPKARTSSAGWWPTPTC